MPTHRSRCEFAVGMTTFLLALASSPVGAQSAATDSSGGAFCGSMTCRWSMVSAGVLAGALSISPTSVPMAKRTEQPADAPSNDFGFTLADCAPCKINNRPFEIPPGIMSKFLQQQIDTRNANQNGNAHGENDNAQGQNGNGQGQNDNDNATGNTNSNGNGNGNGNSGGRLAALATPVTSTPEPRSLLLLATGMLVLVPVTRRLRRG